LSTRYLEALCHPDSIAVIGASERTLNLGGIVLLNIKSAGFPGKLMVVNPKGYDSVHDIPCVNRVASLPLKPDMAIVCTPPTTVPSIINELGKRKVKVAVILTAGLTHVASRSKRPLALSVRDQASRLGIRILGPESMGIIIPHNRLNASFMKMGIRPGKIAYIGQSVAVTNAIIDWASSRDIGFSYMTTLGDGTDIKLEDLIDYFCQDRRTNAILLHIESITSPRRYISAVRAVSRGKPVIVMKSGRFPESQCLPIELPAGLNNVDKVYDAVLRRAGVLRVNGADEMFDAMETLTRMKPIFGETLHIVGNGFGPGVIAADRLLSLGGKLGTMSADTINELACVLPAYWTRRNPIDIDYSAGPALYTEVLGILSRDKAVSNVLVMFSPAITEDSLQVADAVIEFSKRTHLNILTCWLGKESALESQAAFFENGIPSYSTPDKAAKALIHMVNHQRSQKLLRETPESFSDPNINHLRLNKIIQKIYESGRRILTNGEVRNILLEYGLPLLDTYYCDTEAEVVAVAEKVGKPVTVRILHTEGGIPFRGITTNKGRFRGRVKGLAGQQSIKEACQRLTHLLKKHFPGSQFKGFSVQASFQFSSGVGFSIGITTDPVFGPLIVCGAAGDDVNVMQDRCVALPPLNMVLARDLLNQTQMRSILKSQSHQPEQDINRLCETLVTLSRIAIDIPEIYNLEVVPFYFQKSGPVAVNATIELSRPIPLSILPYPQDLREWIILPRSKRRVELRPVRGEDEPAHNQFVGSLSPETIRYRFFHYRKTFTHDDMVQMLQIDYDREMAFIASALVAEMPLESEPGRQHEVTLGVVRAWTDADNLRCEFAIVVGDDVKGERLGWVMMRKIIEYCRDRGTIQMIGSVLPDNKPMLGLARSLGFSISYDEDEEVMALTLPLNKPDEWQAERLKNL